MKKAFFSTWFLLLCLVFAGEPERPYVLLVSFDGFRADYLEWYPTPNFHQLATQGVRAEGLRPVFISKTFPNHYSIATGMYAEHHGLIANTFYDPRFNETYRISDRSKVEDPRWYEGEPIWVTAEKQGVKTASFYWVGSEAPIQGVYPSYWKRYDETVPFPARIDTVMAWFRLPPPQHPHLVLLYFHEPDATGHDYGPRSPETKQMVASLDSLLGILLDSLKALPIYPDLNLLLVSDHGMAATTPERTIKLQDYMDLTGIIQEGYEPTSFLYGVSQNRLITLRDTLEKAPHLRAYLKEEIPPRYHYRDNYRIKDLLLVADEGWLIRDITMSDSTYSRHIPQGMHGYDNSLRSMEGLFVADGPAFKNGHLRGTLENVNIYPLIAYILQIEPNPQIDGKLSEVEDLLLTK